ncbi:unnamed protein product [Peronospora belbahrii]|uniref:Peptidase M14 domain-containing protein n=1 Tax=Peronospora belbahrii TaxID=622444 RepID=A0AAU9KU24_9STRA|nr:unnamed protein product [Peronospora belbahrii]
MSRVSITNGAIELQANSCSKVQITLALMKNSSLYRLSLRIQLPQDGRALLQVELPMMNNVTMALGSGSADAAKNEVLISSSQNTSVFVELPCISDVADTFHDVAFVWDKKWMRWYVDEVLLLEEFIQDESARRKSDDDYGKVVLDLSVTTPGGQACSETDDVVFWQLVGPFLRSTIFDFQKLSTTSTIFSSSWIHPWFIVEELGRSVEKRPLRAICLGACYAPQEQKIPQALFTGMHHAREPISMMNLVYTIDILTSDYRNGDLAALELLTSRQLWFILVVNPDGYAHNEMLRIWEHNKIGRRKSAAPTCYSSLPDAGVDLNRNYDVCFARDANGSSNEPCGDDYNGPSAFSEPETQAVRNLVERQTSDFSVALNYHSYGMYFNLPFACKAEGEPTGTNNSIFVALAQEVVRFNGFRYGQSWKESSLYTVNGETSDWMWQAHGIFAMSPEVGPAFEVTSVLGFWPPRDDVPQLSSALHYSNLYMSRMAGPVYSLLVNRVQLGTTDVSNLTLPFIYVDVTISNRGLRPGTAELVASLFVNGASASDIVRLELEAVPDGSGSLAEQSHTLAIPNSEADFHHSTSEIKALYIVVRDTLSCHLFRVAVYFDTVREKRNYSNFQTWTALPLPRCGTCEVFGSSGNSSKAGNDLKVSRLCHEIKDVTYLKPISTRPIGPLAVIHNRVDSSAEPGPTPKATPPNSAPYVASSSSTSEEMTKDKRASFSSSLASPTWSNSVAMASLVSLVVLIVAILFFRCYCRKNNKKAAEAKAASMGQSKVQYSRIAGKGSNLPARDREVFYEEENEEQDSVVAEIGERNVSADD